MSCQRPLAAALLCCRTSSTKCCLNSFDTVAAAAAVVDVEKPVAGRKTSCCDYCCRWRKAVSSFDAGDCG